MKTCFKCLCEKHESEFYKHSGMADGLLGKCKSCARNDIKNYRKLNAERLRVYEQIRSKQPHRILISRKICADYKKNNRKKTSAQAKLLYAVKTGKVLKQLCWVCGDAAEAHHPDYDRPLDVVWLCSTHHHQTHAIATTLPF